MNKIMEQLKNRLEAKDIKPTYIRLKILNYIEGNKMHPTASMIYNELIKEMPTISKMSIYNTLNSFLEKGIALPIIITGQEVRFDVDMSLHHHFLCEKCGKIINMDIECRYC
jgi:Fur family peroxide stress response transcriptional regulator